MNLLEILLEYLSKEPNLREKYLTHIVEDCLVDPVLIPHIRGLEKRAEVTYNGFIQIAQDTPQDQGKDVNLWLLKLYTA